MEETPSPCHLTPFFRLWVPTAGLLLPQIAEQIRSRSGADNSIWFDGSLSRPRVQVGGGIISYRRSPPLFLSVIQTRGKKKPLSSSLPALASLRIRQALKRTLLEMGHFLMSQRA